MLRSIAAALALLIVTPAYAISPTLQWDPVTYDSPIVYTLCRDSLSGAGNYLDECYDTTATEFIWVDIPVDTVNYYAVKACTEDKSICSGWSNEVQYPPAVAPTAPPTPVNLTIIGG